MRGRLRWTLALLAACALPAWGDGGGGSSPARVERQGSDYEQAVEAIKGGRFERAIGLLEVHTRRNPTDADGWNWLGYARRKSGALDAAFLAYGKALEIDPKHRGAHEYVGEAYLAAGDLASAEKHLAILDRLCWLPCEQHADLARAIAGFKTAHPAR